MHMLIAFITAVASLLYALERLGVDIGWINPWAWKRKRKWLKQYHANPAFSVQQPMEAMGILLAATAKIEGDLSSDEKNELLRIFETEFHLASKQASELLSSTIYLLDTGQEVFQNPEEVLTLSLDKFSQEQKESSIELLNRIALVGGQSSEIQLDYIARIKSVMFPEAPSTSWS